MFVFVLTDVSLRSFVRNFVSSYTGCVEMVKLFIGNLPREATEQEIRSLFEQYGKVLECDIIKNYGFVHIEDKTAAEDAIRNLHHYKLHGVNINVEAARIRAKPPPSCMWATSVPPVPTKSFGPSLRSMVQSSNVTS